MSTTFIQPPTRMVRKPERGKPTPEEMLGTRQEQIRRGMENEAEEEAKLGGRNGHEVDSGGSPSAQPITEELDELIDGSPGTAAEVGGPRDEVYTQMPEVNGGGAATTLAVEVEDYEASVRAPERFVTPELVEFPEIVHGTDDRVRVFNTTSFPWRTICKLEITAADGSSWGCSGAFLGPRTVLTNGHCVFMHDHGGWVRQVRVIPGMNGSTKPFGTATSTFYHSVKGWTESHSSNYDYAVVVLPSTQKLGNQVGWMGLANLSYFSLLGLNVNNSGYPGDKPYGTQWWNANNILVVTDRRVYYQIDTYGGQSGSPDWRYKDGQRHIVAVHNTGGSPFNGGVRIIEPVFSNLVTWKNAYT